MTEPESRLLDDHFWAATAPEVLQFGGQVVVVHKRRVLGTGLDRRELVARVAARENIPEEELAVIVVHPNSLDAEIPH